MLESGTAQYQDFVTGHNVNLLPGARSIIVVDVHQAGSSCGFSVPLFDFKEHRQILNDLMAKKEEKYKAGNEKESFDRCGHHHVYWIRVGSLLSFIQFICCR